MRSWGGVRSNLLSPAPPSPSFFSSFFRFQSPGFVLSQTIVEAAAFPLPLQKPSWEVGKNHHGTCADTLPRPARPQGREQQRPPRHPARAGVTTAPRPPPPPPSRAGETPKGSLNTIYKYYGLWARASPQSRPPIGRRPLAYLHSRIAQPGGDLGRARPSPPAGARGRAGRRVGTARWRLRGPATSAERRQLSESLELGNLLSLESCGGLRGHRLPSRRMNLGQPKAGVFRLGLFCRKQRPKVLRVSREQTLWVARRGTT